VQEEIDKIEHDDVRLVTVLDDSYPPTLRLIYNLPPFLFIRGAITDADLRSVAVVGTRKASVDGINRAGRMARLLVGEDVTVVSGLACGIDTAAHTAALEARGRIIAVIGTGINCYYPAENRALADQITKRGAVVSQFWPDSPPTAYTFPRRNVTMSGIAQGTVVIEASNTSGAKMQARIALEHDKKVNRPGFGTPFRSWEGWRDARQEL
jgi:DNA processing protein